MGAFLIYSVGAWLGGVLLGWGMVRAERGLGGAWLGGVWLAWSMARAGRGSGGAWFGRGAFQIYSSKAWLG